MLAHARNVAILVLIAAVVVFLPGGSRAAGLFAALLSIIFAAAIAFFAGRTYLERRTDIYGLEERHRAIVYAAIAGLVLTAAAASRLVATGAGALGMVALLGLCGYGLFYVFSAWRRY
ncbi:MAG: hypothetical protein ACR2KV_16110 [Solirubrobacteraceae bacterium]